VNASYSYYPQGVYQGRLANGSRGGNGSVAAQVQQQLAAGGYYHGEIDGIIGEATRRAIRKYEQDNNLPVDGQIDDQLLATMRQG
jgi:peptidoglycan hydrolase-like protein with peptidoglycan-binding domain